MSTSPSVAAFAGNSLKSDIARLAAASGTGPCVTISLNTHRTHPANAGDLIALKNLCHEAEQRVISEFGKRPAQDLLSHLDTLVKETDPNYLLDSLHVFLSNEMKLIIRSPWPTHENTVHVSDSFALRPLIKAYNRSQEYLLMLLSQSGVHLYHAINDAVIADVRNDDFPFGENRHYLTHGDGKSDPKQVDDMVREFLNKVDKALVSVANQMELPAVVICTEDNYSRLMQVADQQGVYLGYAPVDYNQTAAHHIASQAWEIIRKKQEQARAKAIDEMKEAVAGGRVVTDLNDIYRAAKEGRGELLIVHQDFSQPVLMRDEHSFDLIDDPLTEGAIDDISSTIAWEVMAKKGRVVVTGNEQILDLGAIALKTRY